MAVRLQYMGFKQVKDTREYVFHLIVSQEEIKVFVVATDMAMFLKHHVGMQEGPLLCFGKLATELAAVESTDPAQPRRPLTDQDMLSYIAAGGLCRKQKVLPLKPWARQI